VVKKIAADASRRVSDHGEMTSNTTDSGVAAL
jgi:hypothetical protein